ncbi:hypothetical protein THIOM_001712 [Candidatus Thiomargarita nelsonii]|uniref:Transglutaminase-like domain-containing protein n=1 Tax=Candidatus Thiomargarita nelsonii TaxID=1003181 RepID=A0A176S306_9GAMM|nr:hypothetical protein THIOM_001712 [Candidatus Thiomargarita nelsonii]
MATIDAYVFWLLKEKGLAARFQFVNDLQVVKPQYEKTDLSYWVQFFPESEPLTLMSSLMNKVNKVELNPPWDAVSLFEHVQKGKGLACSGMAEIFASILAAKKFTVRRVGLLRTLGDRYSAHAIIEILVNGRWVIFDPTFNVTFERDGHLVGAQDIHRALLDGNFNEIKPIFHGEVAYPARLDKYYMHYLSLYNNVLILEPAKKFWHKLPPFRYWMGTKYYVQIEKELGQRNEHMHFFNNLNFFFVALLPIVLISLFFIATMFLIYSYKRDNSI